MTTAIIVVQFVVIILLSVGWWLYSEEVQALLSQLRHYKKICARNDMEIRELKEDNRIIINELQGIRETKLRINIEPEDMAARAE